MEINNKNEFNEFINNDYVLVDFYATWCGPCKMMSPILEKLAEERSELQIGKVDVDKLEDVAREYGVMSIPTLILFKNGNLIEQKVGYTAEPLLIDWINKNK